MRLWNRLDTLPAISAGCSIFLLLVLLAPSLLIDLNAQEHSVIDPAQFLKLLDQARAATAKKQWSQAAALWEKVTKDNPVSGTYWFQLANARYNVQDYRGAVAAYEHAIPLGIDALPGSLSYSVAKCYGRLGEHGAALEWFEKAMSQGFRDLGNAQHDADLQVIQNDPRFRELVGLVDPTKFSRVDGWRYDLKLMAREVERRGYSPFRQISREEFEKRVAKLNTAIPRMSDIQITTEMMKLVAALGDGHSMIYPIYSLSGQPLSERPEFLKNISIQLEFFQEGLFVTAAASRLSDLLGAQVLGIDGHSIDDVLRAVDPVISRDNPNDIRLFGPMMMRNLPVLAALGVVTNPNSAVLTIRDLSGSTRTVTLRADSDVSSRELWNGLPKDWIRFVDTLPGPVPLYLKNPYTDYWFEYLDKVRTVYVQWNHVHSDPAKPIADFFDEVSQFVQGHPVDRLVLDIRWNNGGNTYLVPAVVSSLIQNTKINQPGKLFVITGNRTFSAAQNAATMLERFSHATFVGDTTGSSPNFVGEDAALQLPHSKLTLSISDLYWQSSWPTDHRVWIAPLLYTPPTLSAYRANRDTALDAIIAYPAVAP